MSDYTFSQTIHGNKSLPWITLGLFIFAALLYLTVGAAPSSLVYLTDQPLVEWYRIFTGHWVHSDIEHASLNLIALLILGVVFEPVLKKRVLSVLLFSSLAVSIWTGFLAPDLKAYCGLSGILNSLLVYGCLTLWKQYQQKIYLLFILLAATKTIVEITSQQAMFSHTSWPAIPQAHLIGMLAGAIQFYLTERRT